MPRAFWGWPLLLIWACGPSPPSEARPPLPSPDEVRAELSGLGLDDFMKRSFELLLARSPEAVIDLHLEDQIPVGRSFVDDISDGFVQETQQIERVLLELVRGYSEDDVSRRVYEWYLDDRVRAQAFADLEYRVAPTVISVPANLELFFTDVHPLDSADDADKYAARLWSAGAKMEALVVTMKRLKDAGLIEPQLLLRRSRGRIVEVGNSDPRQTPYYQALEAKLPSDADPEVLDRAAEAIEASIQPAYQALVALIDDEMGSAPSEIGVWQHPGGDAYYLWALRHHVTADVTPEQLHQLGLDELVRIHADLDAHFVQLGYPSGARLADQIERVAIDGGHIEREQVVSEYEAVIRDAESRLSEAFDLLPTSSVIVKGVDYGGFYVAASLDGSRPGAFFASVGGDGEDRFGMRTLAYHEAVPGHHLQVGVAQDLPLPLFQRVVSFTGYAEGWALYAEWLAGQLGWYADDPYGDIGRLQAEAFRAARLVVDTGIHAEHWTFDQAVEFMQHNMGCSQPFAEDQVLRYAAWPGQATAYYTGRAKILDLRRASEHALADRFDQKAFHRAVLSHGSLPLEELDRIVSLELH